jgi:hypothetical protein
MDVKAAPEIRVDVVWQSQELLIPVPPIVMELTRSTKYDHGWWRRRELDLKKGLTALNLLGS